MKTLNEVTFQVEMKRLLSAFSNITIDSFPPLITHNPHIIANLFTTTFTNDANISSQTSGYCTKILYLKDSSGVTITAVLNFYSFTLTNT